MISWRQLIFHNFWLKLFSLVLAGLIWFIVNFDLQNSAAFTNDVLKGNEEELMTNITVAVLSSPGDPRRFTIQPPNVNLVLSGRGAMLRSINPGEVRVFVDLRGFKKPDPTEPVLVNLLSGRSANSLRVIPAVVTVQELKN